jgi:dephospho-CoA kinase
MLRIGLTGGIGSGKTTVAKIFELLHVPVYYADAASKRLYHTNADLKSKLKEHFGEDVYMQGQLDRARLASLVFNNEEKLTLLNSWVHPLTIKDAHDWMNGQVAPYVIKEAALLFESGSNAGVDYVVGVDAPPEVRIGRVMERDGLSRDEVLARMGKQLGEGDKMKLCDFVITNNECELVIPQVLKLHEVFLSKKPGKEPNRRVTANESLRGISPRDCPMCA